MERDEEQRWWRSLTRSSDPPAAGATARLMTRSTVLSHSRSPSLQELRDGCDKVGHVDGFTLVRLKPGGHDLLPVRAHHGRGHGHDGNLPRGLVGSEPSGRLAPVGPRPPSVTTGTGRA